MKKLKRFVLRSGINCLTDFEQMSLIGGTSTGNECTGKKEDQCSGTCFDSDGYEGSCLWINKYDACMCLTIYIG